jgi:hypothetical protein
MRLLEGRWGRGPRAGFAARLTTLLQWVPPNRARKGLLDPSFLDDVGRNSPRVIRQLMPRLPRRTRAILER